MGAIAVTLLFAFGLQPMPASAQSDGSERGPRDPVELEAFLDGLMADEMARLDVLGAAIVVVHDGDVLLLRGYGLADRENGNPVDPSRTVFRIGSVSKPLTSLAALQQVERGNLDLDADVNGYLEFRIEEKEGTFVTLESLLTHTSGFEERLIGLASRDADGVEPLGEYLRDNVPARFAPTGTVHSYSNLGYALVGHLVQRGSGQDFIAYTDDNVFEPLGMESSSFAQELPAGLAARLAVGYVGGSGEREPQADWMFARDYPASGAVTTAADMGRFMIALLEGGEVSDSRAVRAETAAAYLAPAYRPDPTVPGRTTGGLEELPINGEQAVGHGGDIFSYAAELVLVPADRTGIFLVYNVAVDELREDVVRAFFDRYYPDRAAQPSFVELDGDELERFAGKYRWTRYSRTTADKVLAMTPPYNTFVEANSDGTLTVSWLGVDEQWTYRPTGGTTFARVSGDRAVVDGLVLDPGDRLSFSVEHGEVRYLHTSQHTIALERVPVYLFGVVQAVAFVTIALLFLVSLLVWPIGALLRRRRGRPRQGGWARAALWLVVGIAFCVTLGTFALFLGISDDVVYGATPIVYLAAGLITVASVAGLLLIPAAAGAWWRRWFTVGGRLYYSVLALAVPVLLWWANYWNLLGFRF